MILGKVCPKCQTYKDAGGFFKAASRKDGLKYECKECAVVARRKWALENPERVRHLMGQFNRNNPEKNQANVKAWRKANRGKAAAQGANRRSAKRNATPPWLSEAQFAEIEKIYVRAAAFCRVTGESFEVDHIVPLTHPRVCGLHVPWNLQILLSVENARKGNFFEV